MTSPKGCHTDCTTRKDIEAIVINPLQINPLAHAPARAGMEVK